MSDWTAGYQADITYTYGYYQELNPLSAKISLLSAGLNFPKIKTACELGYGQGISANLLAAASDIEWYGTDFNPSQAALAREMGEASGARIHLYDDSFAEFLDRSDLPDFDFIALHGIWSWVSDLNRELILRFIQTRLRVGGVLSVSYTHLTLPTIYSV